MSNKPKPGFYIVAFLIVAGLIGYSWGGVERWEKDQCVPKPGGLWHLFSLYGIGEGEGNRLGLPYPHLRPELVSGSPAAGSGPPGLQERADPTALKKAG